MKITTWNVNGVRAREAEVYEFLKHEAPDVLCLQEIKASPHQVPASLTEIDGYWSYWHGHKGYSGVALLVRQATCPVRPVFSHPAFDHENRIVVVTLGSVLVASMYVPNGGKDFASKMVFLEALNAFVKEQLARGQTLVLCGDLNVALLPIDVHEKLRDAKALGQTEGERALLKTILSHGLTDLGRHFAPNDEALFTWWAPWRQYRERNIGWRLDYVLASADAAARAQSCTAQREFGTSDHGPVTAVFHGPLFEAHEVVAGFEPPELRVSSLPAATGAPQLDLFGAAVKSSRE